MKNWFWCILLWFEIFAQRVHCENTKIYILKPQLWLLAQNALTKWVLNMDNFCLKYPFIWDATTKHLEKQKKKRKKEKKKTEIISVAKKLWKGKCNFIFNFFSFPGWNYKCSKEKRKKKKVENEIRKFCPTTMSSGKLWRLLHIKFFYSYHLIFFFFF